MESQPVASRLRSGRNKRPSVAIASSNNDDLDDIPRPSPLKVMRKRQLFCQGYSHLRRPFVPYCLVHVGLPMEIIERIDRFNYEQWIDVCRWWMWKYHHRKKSQALRKELLLATKWIWHATQHCFSCASGDLSNDHRLWRITRVKSHDNGAEFYYNYDSRSRYCRLFWDIYQTGIISLQSLSFIDIGLYDKKKNEGQ